MGEKKLEEAEQKLLLECLLIIHEALMVIGRDFRQTDYYKSEPVFRQAEELRAKIEALNKALKVLDSLKFE